MSHGLEVRIRSKAKDPEILSAMTNKVLERVGPLGFLEFYTAFTRTPSLRLDHIQVPVMILVGIDDFPAIRSGNPDLAAALPHGCFENLPNCGHFPMIENPEALANRASEFFTENLK